MLTKKKVSKKVKSHTPLLFAITQEQKSRIRNVPQNALKAILDGVAVYSDLRAVMFRIRSCYEISKDIYIEENQEQFADIVKELEVVHNNFANTKVLTISREVFDKIQTGLDAAYEMDDQITRKQMLDPYYRTKLYVDKFVNPVTTV